MIRLIESEVLTPPSALVPCGCAAVDSRDDSNVQCDTSVRTTREAPARPRHARGCILHRDGAPDGRRASSGTLRQPRPAAALGPSVAGRHRRTPGRHLTDPGNRSRPARTRECRQYLCVEPFRRVQNQMQESLLDDDDLLNETDGLGGEDEPAPPSRGGGGGDEREDEHVPREVRQEQRELKKRAKERAKEQRDAKVVQMILREQQELSQSASGAAAAATKEELKRLDSKKLREKAVEVGCDKEELDKLFKEEDEKRNWSAVVKSLKRLAQEAYPERRLLAIATVALFLDTCVGLAIPAYFGKILDTATDGAIGDMQAIKDGRMATTLALVGLTLFGSCFSATRDILFKVTGQRVVLRLRKRLFTHMMHQDVAFFDKTKSGELVNRLSADVMMLKSAVENAWQV